MLFFAIQNVYLFLDKVMLTPINRKKHEFGISVTANGKMSIFIEVIQEISAEQRLSTLDMANRIGVNVGSLVCKLKSLRRTVTQIIIIINFIFLLIFKKKKKKHKHDILSQKTILIWIEINTKHKSI